MTNTNSINSSVDLAEEPDTNEIIEALDAHLARDEQLEALAGIRGRRGLKPRAATIRGKRAQRRAKSMEIG